jgi:flagellar basal-body rod protein FlgC
MINPLSTSISGLQAASKKIAVAASNVANADVVGSTDANSPNQAYSAKTTQDISSAGGGVQTVVLNRNPPFVPSFEPDSPFANSEGMVNAPNVNLDEELVTSKMAENSYKANLTALKTGLEMQDTLRKALDEDA